jgi:hypothetical protein
MIRARITSRYGDVYLREISLSLASSCAARIMTYGLFLGMADLPPLLTESMPDASEERHIIRHIIYGLMY